LFSITDDPVERRRRSGRVTRLLRLFADHGLIRKIAKTHRYRLTAAFSRHSSRPEPQAHKSSPVSPEFFSEKQYSQRWLNRTTLSQANLSRRSG
jgi:hypothetical protein